jgi:peptidoglycan/xylan/chitin deacetylase (PgdA/CDA1 family)
VLDVLDAAGIRATFFVLGRKIADPKGRAIAREAAAQGHWIGNHTMSHKVPLGRVHDDAETLSEIMDTQGLIGDLALGQGGRFRQDFPPGSVPLRRGEAVGDLGPYVTQ